MAGGRQTSALRRFHTWVGGDLPCSRRRDGRWLQF